jgi:hypothetical protein
MEFKDVTIVKKSKIYFDGKVTSRMVIFPDGSKKTLASCFPEIMNSARRRKKLWRF